MMYTTTLVAVRFNPVIKAYYQGLSACSKEKKVAMVVCMRKMVVILNAMIRDRRPSNACKHGHFVVNFRLMPVAWF